MALVEDGALLGSRQLDMGNSGLHHLTGRDRAMLASNTGTVGWKWKSISLKVASVVRAGRGRTRRSAPTGAFRCAGAFRRL